MRYIILGAGAVGGVIGGRLHAAGRQVVLVARGAHLEAIQADGLRIATPEGAEVLDVPAVGHVSDAGLTGEDVVILAVKSQHTAGVLDDLAAVAPPGIAVVCAQNGVANERAALRRFPHVYGMCVILPARHEEPGVVVQHSMPPAGVLDLGRYPSGSDERAATISADLEAAGFRSEATPDVMRLKYRKLLMNLGNALDALAAESFGTDLFARAQAEGLACLEAAGIEVQPAEEEQARRSGRVGMQPVEGRSHASSSRQSLARGAGSIETDWLNGEIVLLGRLHGVPTPVNEALQRLATRAAREHLPPGSMSAAEVEAEIRR